MNEKLLLRFKKIFKTLIIQPSRYCKIFELDPHVTAEEFFQKTDSDTKDKHVPNKSCVNF